MQYLRRSSLALLLFLLLNTGCEIGEKRQNQQGQFNYDQAVKMAKQHVLDLGLYNQEEEIRFMYESNNAFWNLYSSRSPEMLEEYGLTDREYYAIIFLDKNPGTRSGDKIIFIDKNEKRIIGFLHNDNFKEYPNKENIY